jgi:LPXTG-motif cell wall-anchored protein
MLLAAMLAMVLAAAAPALGQTTQTTQQSVSVDNSICTNVVQIAANQYNAGDQVAVATAGDQVGVGTPQQAQYANAAAIGNALGVSVDQVNYCLATFPAAAPAPKPTVPPKKYYVPPKKDYVPPKKYYVPPKKYYVPPKKDYVPPKKDYVVKKQYYVPPKKDYVVKKQYYTAPATAKASPTAKAYGGDAAKAAVGYQLPETGGASLLALGAGALLVGGGLLARRIVR